MVESKNQDNKLGFNNYISSIYYCVNELIIHTKLIYKKWTVENDNIYIKFNYKKYVKY